MQPHGRHNRILSCLKKERLQSAHCLVFRRRQANTELEPLPGPARDLLANRFTALSLNNRGPEPDVHVNLVQRRVPPVHPLANQRYPQQHQHQHQHLPSQREAPEFNMDGMDEAIQEREALLASMAYISDETKSQCRINVLELFSDMDPDHLTLVCEAGRWNPEDIVRQVVNDMEEGRPYPKPKKVNLKRKRDEEEDVTSPENAAKKWDNVGRRTQFRDPKSSYTRMSHSILQQFFPQLYVDNLKSFMTQNGGILYPTYLLLSKALATGDETDPLFRKKKGRVPKNPPFLAGILDERIRDTWDEGEREALEEVRAARIVEQIEAAEAADATRKEQQELDNFEMARAEGTIADCGCCFVEYAINRMVHCDGEEVHFFCRDCARTMAETQIGMAKYNLDCMSTDGCTGGFAHNQREIFLDAKSRTALEQIEMDASIRASGIDNIETCPFCPFAAEYPDLEVNREFRCLHKDCGIVSCRACRKETHIPMSCEEAALEHGHSARHGIEEAMSAALIRKCNKCATPFIKEHGCNKMACTKCGNIQCYVCSKSCDYSHFNDTRRGGKVGNCELFDKEGGVEARHQEEVRIAEEEARKKVQEEHRDLNPELLEFKESEKIRHDEARRKQEHVGRYHGNRGDLLHAGRHVHEMLARRRDVFGHARAAPPVAAPGRLEAGPPPLIAPPEAAHARIAAVQEAPPRPPGPVHVVYQEPAMDPAFIWGEPAAAPQAQPLAPAPAPAAPAAPAQALDPHRAPQPLAGYGNGHLIRFPPLGNDALNQAMDQALAQLGPAIRRSMPPHNYFASQGPQDVANQNPHRAARVKPEGRPVNLLNDPFLRGPGFDHVGFPLAQNPGRFHLTGSSLAERGQSAAPNRPGAHDQPNLASPPLEQPTGNRDDPIVLSSPIRPNMVDLTIGEGDVEAARKLRDIEDGRFWPNLLDLDHSWAVDLDGVDPWRPIE